MITLVRRSIKNTNDQKVKYYPAIAYSGTISRDALIEQISSHTTFTPGDILSTLTALEELIAQKLQNGGSVRLGSFGSFRTSIRANGGEANKEDVTADHIKALHCIFSPSKTLNDNLKSKAKYNYTK